MDHVLLLCNIICSIEAGLMEASLYSSVQTPEHPLIYSKAINTQHLQTSPQFCCFNPGWCTSDLEPQMVPTTHVAKQGGGVSWALTWLCLCPPTSPTAWGHCSEVLKSRDPRTRQNSATWGSPSGLWWILQNLKSNRSGCMNNKKNRRRNSC